ncbi:amino acid--tRNA ligase-related protein [Candidatus Carsonella ruddii]|uniref:amino acid--tRNA ligase-related protein n=1 Tax=Carsonella ruddii TaxID=114186 RepID=UPI003D9A77E5
MKKLIKNFFLFFSVVKKIKQIGKILFLNLYINKININLVFKNLKIKIKPSLIGIYGFNNKKTFYIFELCYFKNKINKFNNYFYKNKSNFFYFIRFFFFKFNFFEMDVPLIVEYSKSGSKQFLIINKKKKNEFYSLSQSPQCIKQYYMFNNIKKYFKIISCFRDEDERSSRLKEFSQLDIELSFTNFFLLKNIIKILIKSILFYFLKKKIFFITIKYKYVKKLFFEKKNFQKPYIYKKIKINIFFCYLFKSIYICFFKKNFFFYKFNKYIIILSKKKIDFNLCYYFDFCLKYLNIINQKIIFFWYVNFFYFKNKKINHHQFSSYKNNFISILKSKSLSYDLIINGIEIGGGSIRNLDFNIQKKNFFLLKEKKSKFLNFFKKNIPQHCGIAIGLERFLSLIFKINIQNTITYKKYKNNIKSCNIYDIN